MLALCCLNGGAILAVAEGDAAQKAAAAFMDCVDKWQNNDNYKTPEDSVRKNCMGAAMNVPEVAEFLGAIVRLREAAKNSTGKRTASDIELSHEVDRRENQAFQALGDGGFQALWTLLGTFNPGFIDANDSWWGKKYLKKTEKFFAAFQAEQEKQKAGQK